MDHRQRTKKCPAGIDPPPCWDVLLTPLGVDTIRPLISVPSRWSRHGPMAIPVARRELVSISGISKAGNFADVEFTWRWVSINPVGAALYDSGVHYRSTVGFRSYDDGWRVVEQAIPSNQPLEDALRNAQPMSLSETEHPAKLSGVGASPVLASNPGMCRRARTLGRMNSLCNYPDAPIAPFVSLVSILCASILAQPKPPSPNSRSMNSSTP
jgi:hypothetical protein